MRKAAGSAILPDIIVYSPLLDFRAPGPNALFYCNTVGIRRLAADGSPQAGGERYRPGEEDSRAGAALERLGTEKGRDVATAVQHTGDFDALCAFTIEDHVIADREAPD